MLKQQSIPNMKMIKNNCVFTKRKVYEMFHKKTFAGVANFEMRTNLGRFPFSQIFRNGVQKIKKVLDFKKRSTQRKISAILGAESNRMEIPGNNEYLKISEYFARYWPSRATGRKSLLLGEFYQCLWFVFSFSFQ